VKPGPYSVINRFVKAGDGTAIIFCYGSDDAAERVALALNATADWEQKDFNALRQMKEESKKLLTVNDGKGKPKH
jgi:hypothetical protein